MHFCLDLGVHYIEKYITPSRRCTLPLIFSILSVIIGIFFIYLGFKSEKDLFTGSAAIFVVSSLFYTAHTLKQDKEEKKSEFYLKQIQLYFQEVKNKVSCQNNSNIEWNSGLECLIIVERLFKKLTKNEHKVIYLYDYLNIGYFLLKQLFAIEDYIFFYGLSEKQINEIKAKKDDHMSLATAVSEKIFDKKSPYYGKSITPYSLDIIRNVIDKSNRIKWALDENRLNNEIINTDYFQKDIRSSVAMNGLIRLPSVVDEYKKHYIETERCLKDEVYVKNKYSGPFNKSV